MASSDVLTLKLLPFTLIDYDSTAECFSLLSYRQALKRRFTKLADLPEFN